MLNNINIGTFFIKFTGRNTFISIFKNAKLLRINSCGLFGFKGRKKETPFACSTLANKSALYVLHKNIQQIHLIFNGIGVYKKIILSTILKTSYNNSFLQIVSITDTTQIPHNGCRPKKIKKR